MILSPNRKQAPAFSDLGEGEAFHELCHRFIVDSYESSDPFLYELRALLEARGFPLIRKETEMFLAFLLDLTKPTAIVEIGTGLGYSSLFFASQARDAKIFTVEKDPNRMEEARTNIKKSGWKDRIRTFCGEGKDVLTTLYQEGMRGIDWVFLDGGKNSYQCLAKEALPLMKKGSLLLCDDVFQRGYALSACPRPNPYHEGNRRHMKQFLCYLRENPAFRTSFFDVGDGFSVSVYQP